MGPPRIERPSGRSRARATPVGLGGVASSRRPSPRPAGTLHQEHGARLRSWRARLDDLLRHHAGLKQGKGEGGASRPTSHATRRNISTGLFRLFSVLRGELGFGLENPARIEARHLQALHDWMEQRWRDGRLQSSTIQGYVSYLRLLCRWVGKPQLLQSIRGFSDERCASRQLACGTDKTWSGAGVDLADILERAWAIEPWVAMALAAQAAFGLRRKEAVCLVPQDDALAGLNALAITRGTKGGRARIVRLHSAWQRDILDLLAEFCRGQGSRHAHLGGPHAGLKANLARYSRVLARLGITRDLGGITGHGLRADYACRLLQAAGITPTVKGGSGRAATQQQTDAAYRCVSEALGHSRRRILAAYCGPEVRVSIDDHDVSGGDATASADPVEAARVLECLRRLSRS